MSSLWCSCSASSLSMPSASSKGTRKGLSEPLERNSPAERSVPTASSMSFCMAGSFTSSMPTIAGTAPSCTNVAARCAQCELVGSEENECKMLATTHAASFLTSKSSWPRRSMTHASSGLRMTESTCSLVPAATFEIAQHASLRVCALVDLIASGSTSRMPLSSTACVAAAEPVRTLQRVRSAGVRVLASVRSRRMAINGATTPCCTTTSMRSSPPSEMYDRAQQVSMITSSSCKRSSLAVRIHSTDRSHVSRHKRGTEEARDVQGCARAIAIGACKAGRTHARGDSGGMAHHPQSTHRESAQRP
mmetsp:Transcript_12010/g.30795  ORF Transcript_12010/g.30795 Transcript_12010/m.30795 type:complete len:305 (+) Transcript_12010:207-1121(+)